MTNEEKLIALKQEEIEIFSTMPRTFQEQTNRNRAAFLIAREIEKLENPIAYAENKNHWDGHEIRF